jgi:hypothetical protein
MTVGEGEAAHGPIVRCDHEPVSRGRRSDGVAVGVREPDRFAGGEIDRVDPIEGVGDPATLAGGGNHDEAADDER